MNNFVIPLDINYPTDQYRQQYTDLYSHLLDDSHPEITVSSDHASYFISAKNYNWGQHIIEDYTGLSVETCRIFVVKPGLELKAHIDCIANSQELRHCSVNIPLLGCNKGFNTWYDQKQFPVKFNARASSIIPQDYNQLKNISPLYRTRVDTPSIFRTDVMHNVDNSDNLNYRVMLSMRLKNNPTFEYMLKNKASI